MNDLKRINKFRRRLTHLLTAKIGSAKSESRILTDRENIKSILVTRPNHRLGNLLLITPLLQELENDFPNATVDVFVKGNLASILLKEYKQIDRIIALPKNHFKQLPSYLAAWFKIRKRKYDLVINAVPDSSSGRLSTKLARADCKIFGDKINREPSLDESYDHIAKHPVYCLRNTISNNNSIIPKTIPSLSLNISIEEIEKGRSVLEKIVGSHKKVLTIFTYATGEKCHSKAWWNDFYEALRNEFPNHTILEILPKEKVSQIDFKAATYYSKDLREICSVIANAEAFIGADSGIMHLAVASKTPVIGLFNVTKLKKYAPYGGQNMAINTDQTSISEIIKKLKPIILTTVIPQNQNSSLFPESN